MFKGYVSCTRGFEKNRNSLVFLGFAIRTDGVLIYPACFVCHNFQVGSMYLGVFEKLWGRYVPFVFDILTSTFLGGVVLLHRHRQSVHGDSFVVGDLFFSDCTMEFIFGRIFWIFFQASLPSKSKSFIDEGFLLQ